MKYCKSARNHSQKNGNNLIFEKNVKCRLILITIRLVFDYYQSGFFLFTSEKFRRNHRNRQKKTREVNVNQNGSAISLRSIEGKISIEGNGISIERIEYYLEFGFRLRSAISIVRSRSIGLIVDCAL